MGRFAVLALALCIAGCADSSPMARLPEGALLAARTEDLARLLSQLEGLEGTRVARLARRSRASLPACSRVEARAPDGDLEALLESLGCGARDGELAALHELRGGRALALALPLADGRRLTAAVELAADGGVYIDAELPRAPSPSLLGLILPSSEPPGPPLLSDANALVRARVRPDRGLNLASLVASGGQADALFHLKSALFEGAVLAGTWEAVVYLPDDGRRMPPMALALDVALRAPAVAAMERFIDELRASWPVHRSAFSVGDAEGACLLDLNVLPELAPCYVATAQALVVGWNSSSVRKALGAAPVRDLGGASGLRVEVDRLGDADRVLAAAVASERPPPGRRPPWRLLRVDGKREGDRYAFRVALEAGDGA